jgi:glutathione reductase (NADPH)
MWHAADLMEKVHQSEGYAYDGMAPKFSWSTFKPKRDAYIHRLRGIYTTNWAKEGIDLHKGFASFVDKNTIEISKSENPSDKYVITADNICIATGGTPTVPSENDIPGANLGIDSDGFFELEEQPKRVAVVGAGYIAVELAGIFNALGSETHLLIRHEKVLRTFDPIIQDTITPWMQQTGVKLHTKTEVTKVEGTKGGPLKVHTSAGTTLEVDCLLWAIGRHSEIKRLNLDKVGVKTDNKGDIVVDEYQNTNVEGVTAIGDVQGKWLLTPVAIAAGRRLANRLFGPEKFKNDKLSYEYIPTVVFSWVLSRFYSLN